jgi:hypothetical protein
MVALFPFGQIVATPGALAALERANQSPAVFLSRHAEGDWGEITPTDIAENAFSIAHGFRLLSSYETEAGETVDHHRSRPGTIALRCLSRNRGTEAPTVSTH